MKRPPLFQACALPVPVRRTTLLRKGLMFLSFLGFFLLFLPCPGKGQDIDTELQPLLERRAQLLQQWRTFNLEENALFGGKSKKDLRNLLQTQKAIIELDNRILSLRRGAVVDTKKSESREALQHRRAFYSRIDSLSKLNTRLQTELDALKKREERLQARLEGRDSRTGGLSFALVLVSALLILSLFYNPFRRKGTAGNGGQRR